MQRKLDHQQRKPTYALPPPLISLSPFTTPCSMCNSAAKLYMEAERSFVLGDHERSYVLFGKYFKTILPLKKREDYRRQKTELDAILGPQSKQLRAIDIMSELRDNLVDRYDKMKIKPAEKQISSSDSISSPNNAPIPDQLDGKSQCNSTNVHQITHPSFQPPV